MESHGLTDNQKRLYLHAVIAGSAALLDAKSPENLSPLAVAATLNPLERQDKDGNRVRHFHTYGHVTRSAEQAIPAMGIVRHAVEEAIKADEERLSKLDNEHLNIELARFYASQVIMSFGGEFDNSLSIHDNLQILNKSQREKVQEAAGLDNSSVMHDVVYNVDALNQNPTNGQPGNFAEPKWLEYVTQSPGALLQVSADGQSLEWNERGKQTLLYKLLAPMEGKPDYFDLEWVGKSNTLGPYPLDFNRGVQFNELLSAITKQQQDLEQGLPEREQLARAVEIMNTYYCKTNNFSKQLFERFTQVAHSIGMNDDQIQQDYNSALTLANKADIAAFGSTATGMDNPLLTQFQFVDFMEPQPGNRNPETMTDIDRANVGVTWFTRDMAVMGLIKSLEEATKDPKTDPAVTSRINEYLDEHFRVAGKIHPHKLEDELGTGAFQAYEKASPREIFRAPPQIDPRAESIISGNNYSVSQDADGRRISKIKANFRALKSYVTLLKTHQAITGTELLIGALMAEAGAADRPISQTPITPLESPAKPAAGLDAGVMERLRNPQTKVDVFGEMRETGHANDKIAAQLLEHVGHGKMAELGALQAKIVMGARFGAYAQHYSPTDSGIEKSRKAIIGEHKAIIQAAEAILGKELVGELREHVQQAIGTVPLAIESGAQLGGQDRKLA